MLALSLSALLVWASLHSSTAEKRQLTRLGNVTMFADEQCLEPVFVNSAIIGRDFCAHSEPSDPVGGQYRGFIVNERPWCDNGSRPYWNVFTDDSCHDLQNSWVPGALYRPEGPDADGTCVSVGGDGFRGYAFVCDGFDLAWGLTGPEDGAGDDGVHTDEHAKSTTTTSSEAIKSTTSSESLEVFSSVSSALSSTSSQANAASTTSELSSTTTARSPTSEPVSRTSDKATPVPTPIETPGSGAVHNGGLYGAVIGLFLTVSAAVSQFL